MIYFGMQLIETIKTGNWFVFELFVLYVFFVWFMKFIPSRLYKTIDSKNRMHNASVVIPVLNEDPKLFLKSLQSITANEIIVVIDANETNTEIETIARGYADIVINSRYAGKRINLMEGIKKAKNDIIISMDSDTVLSKEAYHNMLVPFDDKLVGGVTSRQHIIHPERNLISKFCEWMENVRFSISMPAQSVFGSIGCLPGRAIAFRKSIIMNHHDHFIKQKFLGKICDSGDDRVITGYCLHDGYKTVFQNNSVVYTDCPSKWKAFMQQQLRWARSSQRETILSVKWLWRRPYTFFVFVTDIITPIAFAFVVVYSIYNFIMGNQYFNIPLWLAGIMGLVGMNISLGIRQYPHLKDNIDDLKYLPLYVLFMTFIMTPIRIIGLLTCYRTGWMTR